MAVQNQSDRRQSKRLKGMREAILVTPNGMHHICDISSRGLSFHCALEDFFPVHLPIEIILAGTSLYIKDLPVRLVREQVNEAPSFLSTPTKNVGVEFLDLDNNSKELLQELLTYHKQH